VTKGGAGSDRPGFLLAEDLPVVVRNAGRHWDYAASTATPSTPQR
jgi:hypothetical protein